MSEFKFNYEEMQKVMSSINEKFESLSDSFEITKKIAKDMDNNPDSAVYGDVGSRLFKLWDANASTFTDFEKNFDVWSETMLAIHKRNEGFAENMLEGFASTALSSDGVMEARVMSALSSGVSYIGSGKDAISVDTLGETTSDGSIKYTNSDGTYYLYKTDDKGNLISVSLHDKNNVVIERKTFDNVNGGLASTINYEDGKAIQTIFDSDGRATILKYKNGNVLGNPDEITYYGSNGKMYLASEADGYYIVKNEAGEVVSTSVDYKQIEPYITAASGNSVTLQSGDSVIIAGNDYTVYGFATKNDGTVVSMFADSDKNLFYLDDNNNMQPVMESYSTFDGYTYKEHNLNATVNSIDAEHEYFYTTPSVNDSSVIQSDTAYSSLKIGEDTAVASSSAVIGSATFVGSSLNNNVNLETTTEKTTPYVGVNVSNSVTTNGIANSTYDDEFNNEMKGIKFVTATGMDTFSGVPQDLTEDTSYVVKIPQNQYVQWDSPSGGIGYEFDTSSAPVYLKWNAEAGGYQMVDEYGNITNSRVFGIDGFNDNGGASGGVWE